MKLKKAREDFIVEEINDFEIKSNGEYKLYQLKKVGVETIGLISELERKNNISRKFIGIAGIKDKHAITYQYITIPSKYEFKATEGQGYSLKFLGYIDNQIETGDLMRNRFTLTIRDLDTKHLENIEQRIKFVKENGVPNYFDSQRFGSTINGIFIARFLIKEDYEGALKNYFLTQFNNINPGSKIIKEKHDILNNWNKFETLTLTNLDFRRIQEEYIKTKSWKSAYKMIPSKLKEMFVISYQSYLWNNCIKELINKNFEQKEIMKVRYNVGELFYLRYNVDPSKLKILEGEFLTIGRNFEPSEMEKKFADIVMKKEKLTYDELDNISKSGNFLKSQKRSIISKPINLTYTNHERDELNTKGKGKFKMTISFELEKGSYATNMLKGIFWE